MSLLNRILQANFL